MFKFFQAIIFMVLLVAVIFLGNHILEKADVDFTSPESLANQKAVIAENVTQLKKVTEKKADELRKLYESIKHAEQETPSPDALPKKAEASFLNNTGQDLPDEKKISDPDKSFTSNDSGFLAKIDKIQKMYDPEEQSEQGLNPKSEKPANNFLTAKSPENHFTSPPKAEPSSAQLSPMDKEDHELTKQIMEFSAMNTDSAPQSHSTDRGMAANDSLLTEKREGASDLDNMAAIMELYSKAAAVLDIK